MKPIRAPVIIWSLLASTLCAACLSDEYYAKETLHAALQPAGKGDFDNLRQQLESIATAYADERSGKRAQDALAKLDLVQAPAPAIIERELPRLVAYARSLRADEPGATRAGPATPSPTATTDWFAGTSWCRDHFAARLGPATAAAAAAPVVPLGPCELPADGLGVLELEARAALAELLALAARVFMGSYTFYYDFGAYTSKVHALGVAYDPARFEIRVIPGDHNDKGYQSYVAEIYDTRLNAFATVSHTAKVTVHIKPEPFVRALLTVQ